MGKHLNPVEKMELIDEFLKMPYVGKTRFARDHNLCESSFANWLQRYEEGGFEALVRSDSRTKHLANKVFNKTNEKSQIREILLEIENERLKKNYRVIHNENGEKVFIPLKEKNFK